jgi:hypothetical protein
MKHITKRKIAASLATGFALGVLAIYPLSECSRRLDERAPPKRREYFAQTVTATVPFNHKQHVGGFELEYVKDDGIVARIRYRTARVRVDTGIRLHAGEDASIDIPEKNAKVSTCNRCSLLRLSASCP